MDECHRVILRSVCVSATFKESRDLTDCNQSLICLFVFFHRQGRSVDPLHVSICLLDVLLMCLGSGYISAHADVLTVCMYAIGIHTHRIGRNISVTSCLVCFHALSVSPVITSSCQTLPVIVNIPFGTMHLLLLDPLQHVFLLKPLCFSSKSDNAGSLPPPPLLSLPALYIHLHVCFSFM